MTAPVLDDFDLDIRLGEPNTVPQMGPQTTFRDQCVDSGCATCGDTCPTHSRCTRC